MCIFILLLLIPSLLYVYIHKICWNVEDGNWYFCHWHWQQLFRKISFQLNIRWEKKYKKNINKYWKKQHFNVGGCRLHFIHSHIRMYKNWFFIWNLKLNERISKKKFFFKLLLFDDELRSIWYLFFSFVSYSVIDFWWFYEDFFDEFLLHFHSIYSFKTTHRGILRGKKESDTGSLKK